MIFKKSVLVLIALSLFNLILAVPIAGGGKKNIIFMVPDGFGPAYATLGRVFKQHRDELDVDQRLNIDPHLIGTIRTRSNSSLITDSAASGSTYATGFKTYNGAISVDPFGTPKGTILEALKSQGYKTGLVVKSTLTDATPGVFASHVEDRGEQDKMAEQMVGLGKLGHLVDYMSGGGKCWWIPQDQDGSCREDDIDLIAKAKELGYNFFESKSEFDDYLSNGLTLPALSFWANEDVDFALDRDPAKTPSLDDQARLALKTLDDATKDSEQGFFIMIEASLIDHCGHNSDSGCIGPETIEFDDTFKVVKDFIDLTSTETVVVAAADHETGGLSLGYHESKSWKPDVLLKAKKTSAAFETMITDKFKETQNNETLIPEIKNWIVNNLSIDDATDEEVQTVLDAVWEDEDIANKMSEILNARSDINFLSYGHSGSDINLYFYTNSEYMAKIFNSVEELKGIKGNHDNTEINDVFALITNADLNAITDKLNN